ncbi:MAG: tagaturonate reductase [Lentisphaerales bacterium]|nr:tagaturonate reductase [Lentisphaerales bacterium]
MKILQFGTGVFIRGFFDWMLQEISAKGLADPQVSLVKLTPHGTMQAYEKQSGEFNVIIRGLKDGEVVNEICKIDRLKEFIHPYNDWGNYLETAADPTYKLVVSNSTEAGLCYDKTASYESCPASFPAKLYAWLKKRYEVLGQEGAIAIMAFELVPENASKLKEILLQLASEDNAADDLVSWLADSCHCINTLVDRIVSKLPSDAAAKLQEEFKVEDDLILCAEPYHLLAVDSEKLEEILPLQKAGLNIEVSANLDAIRERKVKVLNGAHMLVVPAGLALGHDIVLETLENSAIRNFAECCLQEEVAPTVNDPQVTNYIASVVERFENPYLGHRLENIALNSSAKIGQRLFPSIIDYFEQSGRLSPKLLTAVAVFLEFYKGKEVEPGVLETSWGLLKDNQESMQFILSLHGKSGVDAAQAIVDKQFWPVPESMQDAFVLALGEVLETVRNNGINKSIQN